MWINFIFLQLYLVILFKQDSLLVCVVCIIFGQFESFLYFETIFWHFLVFFGLLYILAILLFGIFLILLGKFDHDLCKFVFFTREMKMTLSCHTETLPSSTLYKLLVR